MDGCLVAYWAIKSKEVVKTEWRSELRGRRLGLNKAAFTQHCFELPDKGPDLLKPVTWLSCIFTQPCVSPNLSASSGLLLDSLIKK